MTRQAELDIVIRGDATSLKYAGKQAEDALKQVGLRAKLVDNNVSRIGRIGGGRNIQNVAFQFQDLAVQMGAGTAASVALGQQLPQLLGGFGALGAAIGAVVAIGFPLGRVLKGMADNGRDITSAFGTLQPALQAIGRGMSYLNDVGTAVLESVVNNLDRLVVVAGTAVALFAGKWVVAFVAARIATFSLAAALVTLRGALIRTGVGALIVGLGELIFQFTRLVQAAGGFGNALGLIKDVGLEAFSRLSGGFAGLGDVAFGAGQIIEGVFLEVFGNILQHWTNMLSFMVNGLNEAFGTSLSTPGAGIAGGIVQQGRDKQKAGGLSVAFGQDILSEGLLAPLESLIKIKDVLSSIKDERITLPDLLGVSGGEEDEKGGKSKASKKLDEELTAQEKRIKEHFDRIKALATGGLSDQLGAWGDYFDGLISLTGTSNERLLSLGKAFRAAQALVDAWGAYTQTLADPTLPFFAKLAAAAQVLAAGIGAVNAIRSVGMGGGGSRSAPSGGRGVGTAPQAAPAAESEASSGGPRFVDINFRGATMLPTEAVIGLVEQINEVAGEGLIIRSNR